MRHFIFSKWGPTFRRNYGDFCLVRADVEYCRIFQCYTLTLGLFGFCARFQLWPGGV